MNIDPRSKCQISKILIYDYRDGHNFDKWDRVFEYIARHGYGW